MTALTLTTSTLPAHLSEQVNQAKQLIRNRHAQSTRQAYAADLMTFKAWTDANGLQALPATPDTVVLYLTAQAAEGRAPATLQRRLAAIRHLHREAGYASPTDAEVVSAVMAGVRRTVGAAPRQAAPATGDRIKAMLDTCGDDLVGIRDRALLAVGFAGAMRRSELVALTVESLEIGGDGIRATISKSKTDQESKGQTIALLDGPRLQVKAAVQAWLHSSGIKSGPLFRGLGKGGAIKPTALTDRSVANIVKARAQAAGLDAAEFSGHSLRAGFLTSAAAAGASVWKMAEVSRHRKVETLAIYVREGQLFSNHAGAAFM